MTFWALLRSILLVALCTQPLVLVVAGIAMVFKTGKFDGLAAVLATPMTLAFFGLPVLQAGLFVIIPTYYAFSWFGRRELVPYAVFAVGAATLVYLAVREPVPTGAIPGYDQTAQLFIASTFIAWSLYAYFRAGLRRQ